VPTRSPRVIRAGRKYVNSLPALPCSSSPRQSLVQRLVQKERQVSQMQSEIDHLKSLNPAEIRESVSCYRIQMHVRAGFDPPSPNQCNRRSGSSVNERKPSGRALWMKSPSLRLRSSSASIKPSLFLPSTFTGGGVRSYYCAEGQRVALL